MPPRRLKTLVKPCFMCARTAAAALLPLSQYTIRFFSLYFLSVSDAFGSCAGIEVPRAADVALLVGLRRAHIQQRGAPDS